jgi:hypothetical protein
MGNVINRIATMLFFVAFGILVGWWLTEKPFLSYDNVPFPVLNQPLRAGSIVEMKVVRCNSDKDTRLYGTSREILNLDNGKTYIQPATVVSIKPGCTEGISRINSIPEDAPPGRYKLQGTAEVNSRLNHWLVHWESQPFTVVAK